MKLQKFIAAIVCASLAMTATVSYAEKNEENTETMTNMTELSENVRAVTIDGNSANTIETAKYRGAGMVSGNGTSRLLLDYKYEQPERYAELLEYLFGDSGIGINHLKIEMGADINSSSGTEPTIMRTEDEAPDATRGAGFQLAADARKVNPDLTLDMLWWSEPLWVTNAQDVYAARYKWYKANLDAAFETYGLKFDYVSASRNEKAIDCEWIKYLSSSLKSETDCPYDYAKIKIVAADEVCNWAISNKMLADEELLNAVDVMGSHYTSWSSDNTQKLIREYGKEAWFSEACPSMSYSKGTYRFDETGSGLNDINGLLDVANRIITMYPGGMMTLYEYQPVVASNYDGATYGFKQLVIANTPWSGYYYLDNGFYMSLHFSQFIKKGWEFVDSACYADGVAGGDGHAIVDARYSYITATDPDTGDYSTVITNTTAEPITYEFTVKNLGKASSPVSVWETRGSDSGQSEQFDENYFKKIGTVTPTESGDAYTYSVVIKPYSLVTISTVELAEREYTSPSENTILSLPYADDYEYSGYAEDYLSSRGNAPRYTTDEGGAFEVATVDGNNVLMQMITPDIKANEWGGTPNPTTNFGDDRWYNYSVSVDAQLTKSEQPEENYVGVGLRYNLADSAISGYWLQLYEDGTWKLKRNKRIKLEGKLDSFDASAWHNLKVEANGGNVRAYLDGELLSEYNSDGEAVLSAGRAALYSSYNKNCFDNFKAEPIDGAVTAITRFDNTDTLFTYSGEWTHTTMSSFKNYRRTVSEGSAGSVFNIAFSGTELATTGVTDEGCAVAIKLDGEMLSERYVIPKTGSREENITLTGFTDKEHNVEITVLEGTISLDGCQVNAPAASTEQAEEILPEETEENLPEKTTNEPSETAVTDSPIDEKENNGFIIPIIAGAAAVLAVVGLVVAVLRKKKK